jgi:hypothetical protein
MLVQFSSNIKEEIKCIRQEPAVMHRKLKMLMQMSYILKAI